MYTFLHAKFKFTVCQHIGAYQNIAVALSSGQDSLCLLKLLVDCLNTKQQHVSAIYIDHQWKNSSQKHAQHIVNISKFTKLPVAIYQMHNVTMSENEARKTRYKILMQHALQEGCDAIILGHNSDDHTETLVSNFLRGTSLNGIANFTIKKKLNSQLSILRPLIHFSKAEIGWLCRLCCMPVWSDETNYNISLQRSRIRYELLPYIQNFFNPRIKPILKHFSQLCDLENEYMKENTVKLYTKIIHGKLLGINLLYLKKQHEALRRRVLRLYFHYHFNIQLSSEATEWILLQKKCGSLNMPAFKQVYLHKISAWLYVGIKEL